MDGEWMVVESIWGYPCSTWNERRSYLTSLDFVTQSLTMIPLLIQGIVQKRIVP
jgi:hypothetical protein